MTVIKINALTVPAEMGEEVAKRFAARAGAVDGHDGFEGFELLRPTDERARVVVVAVVSVLMWRYMIWRWFSTLPPVGLNIDWIVGVLFAAVETLAMMGTTIGLIGLTRLSNRTPEVERNLSWLDASTPLPLVDVFICTYNEDEAILENTIVGAASMDYGRFRVWVLDDGLADRCARLIVEFQAAASPPVAGSDMAWQCAACREDNPAGFDLCWACGQSR